MLSKWRIAAILAALFAAFVFVTNTSLLAARPPARPALLAHRGIAQRFDRDGVTNETCTAARIRPPSHGFLENTIPSMRASFAAGADVVEFDVHRTIDGAFAVFHDWTVDCRTEGHGETRQHSLAELKALDIGYGYTADGGRTFPFRGKGVGLMPSLDEVFNTFPDRRFLINIKSNDPAEGSAMAAALGRLDAASRRRLMVYGGDQPVETLRSRLPDLTTMSRGRLKSCLLRYIGLGWSGVVPDTCARMVLLIPQNVAPWLWGWPDRFLNRMEAVGSKVFLVGPLGGSEFLSMIDTADQVKSLPPNYSGGIMTDEIEEVAKMTKTTRSQSPTWTAE
jgi:glycerophosphoryl diester phosphodiesterase